MDSSVTTLKFPNFNEFCSTFLPQNFSLPDSIIYYISRNPPSPKMYQKMVKCCKYFFIKNPILILHCLCNFKNESVWKICDGKKHDPKQNYTIINLNQISRSKLWITCHLVVHSPLSSAATNLIQKLYKCDAMRVDLCQQTLTFNEFLFLTRNVKTFLIDKSVITSEEGTSVIPTETIVENLPKLESLICKFSSDTMNHSANIFTKIQKVSHFKNIKILRFYRVSTDFDFDAFYNFFDNKICVRTFLSYRDPVSDALKDKIESIINERLELYKRHLACFPPPIIRYPGQDVGKIDALKKMWFDLA